MTHDYSTIVLAIWCFAGAVMGLVVPVVQACRPLAWPLPTPGLVVALFSVGLIAGPGMLVSVWLACFGRDDEMGGDR